jgi:hypothetical protein
MRKIITTIIAATMLATPAMAAPKTIYLDKMDKGLNDWWNSLDADCRGESGGDDIGGACDQRLQVDKIIKARGCWNIYPATGKHDTSYWKCAASR